MKKVSQSLQACYDSFVRATATESRTVGQVDISPHLKLWFNHACSRARIHAHAMVACTLIAAGWTLRRSRLRAILPMVLFFLVSSRNLLRFIHLYSESDVILARFRDIHWLIFTRFSRTLELRRRRWEEWERPLKACAACAFRYCSAWIYVYWCIIRDCFICMHTRNIA